MNVRILSRFTLKSPLSHIGETIGTTAYLVQEPVLQPDGAVEEVFVYSGNAWRGHLRDLAARYFLERLGDPTIGLDAFHLLFSGGALGGAQQTNIAQARAYRRALPLVAVWGGGIGQQVLPGKLRVSNFYPVCREAPPSFAPVDPERRRTTSYRGLTFEKSFSRKDDAKDERLAGYLAPRPEGTRPQQGALLPAGDGKAPKPKEGPAQQMRMTVELVAAGVELAGHLDLLDASEVELGCVVSALHAFSRSPHIGGQANRGHGLVSLATWLVDLDTGEARDFLDVDDRCLLAPPAERAKDAYDRHVRGLYDALVEANEAPIRAMLGAGK